MVIDNKSTIDDIKKTFILSKEKIDAHIHELRVRSSDEVLNGSIEEAQKFLNHILPIESAAKKMIRYQNEFVKIIESVDVRKANGRRAVQKNSESEDTLENVTSNINSSENFTTQIEFRLSILKALIYLGGSANVQKVMEFIGKDMRKKLRKGDFDTPNGSGEKRWEIAVKKERELMEAEGLLNKQSTTGMWEIVQRGIDYLSNHGK